MKSPFGGTGPWRSDWLRGGQAGCGAAGSAGGALAAPGGLACGGAGHGGGRVALEGQADVHALVPQQPALDVQAVVVVAERAAAADDPVAGDHQHDLVPGAREAGDPGVAGVADAGGQLAVADGGAGGDLPHDLPGGLEPGAARLLDRQAVDGADLAVEVGAQRVGDGTEVVGAARLLLARGGFEARVDLGWLVGEGGGPQDAVRGDQGERTDGGGDRAGLEGHAANYSEGVVERRLVHRCRIA